MNQQPIVDLTNLRSMTDGDIEIEQALFAEFYSSFEAGIAGLSTHLANPEEWRQQAHALKGIALNLGAAQLSELCKQAEHSAKESIDKEALISHITTEYQQVAEFLRRITY